MLKNFILAGLSLVVAVCGLAALASNSPVMAGNNTVCSTPAAGIISGGFTGTSHTTAVLTNNSQECSFYVGIASYKAYLPYTNDPKDKQWIYTQTYYSSKTVLLGPGQTVHLQVAVPDCAWQVDIFWGSVLNKFTPGVTYSWQGRLIDGGWYETSLPVCSKPTPTPTPTATPTPTPTPTATPTPTPTPTYTPTPTPTCTPTPSPTPTPPVLGVSTTPTPTPVTELPSTGPGEMFAFALGVPLAGLVGKRYFGR